MNEERLGFARELAERLSNVSLYVPGIDMAVFGTLPALTKAHGFDGD